MPETLEVVNALYRGFFARSVRYFFPEATLVADEAPREVHPALRFHTRTDGGLDLEWFGIRYQCDHEGRPFSEQQVRLLAAIGAVLSARYRSIFSAVSVASTTGLFEGLAEDRYVSAFLDHTPYLGDDLPAGRDVIACAIEVIRESSLLTYENRRISTGAILMGRGRDGFHEEPARPCGALPYNNQLLGIKSLHRLCDGLDTIFVVDRDGMLVDLVDMQRFAEGHGRAALPAPSADRYRPHSLITLEGGRICLVLTPNGEIKIFSGGVQVFNFMEGRWRLTDLPEKYREFHRAVGDVKLAERLFTAALNLAESRRGGLFVILDEPEAAHRLVAPQDLLESEELSTLHKGQIHYLLRNRYLSSIELSVLESIARVDGGVVVDRDGRLRAFGAILRNSGEHLAAQDGGRTTAAVHASRFGAVLKISEDGLVSYYRCGRRVWEM